jgi:hypothetical protein
VLVEITERPALGIETRSMQQRSRLMLGDQQRQRLLNVLGP